MTSYEKITIIFSSLAFIVSLIALIVSIIKILNENKIYKQRYITNQLLKLREEINSKLTELDLLDPEIKMAQIIKRLENGDYFDFFIEANELYTKTGSIISDAMLILSSYKPTTASVELTEWLNTLLVEIGKVMKLCIDYRKDKNILIKKYLENNKEYVSSKLIKSKNNFIQELNILINHFVRDKVSQKEINEQFFELKK